MKNLILDTNALMAISELKIDLFSEIHKVCDFPYRLFILKGTMLELKKIIDGQRGKYKSAARLALGLIRSGKVEVLAEAEEKDEAVDDLLVSYSRQGYLIVTQDRTLKKKLTKPYLTIRQKKKVMVVDY